MLLVIAFVVPAILLLAHRDRLVLAWIGICVGFQVLDTSILTNLPAARLVGLLVIPRVMCSIREAWRTTPGRALFTQFLYLTLLAVIFGFIFPWPNVDVARAFNQLAPGRATIYLIRTAADISITLFVAQQTLRFNRPLPLTRWILVGSTVACFGGMLEFITKFDLYGNITGLVPMNYPFRMRGFNFEPRALGLISVQGLLLCLILYSRRRSLGIIFLAGLHAIGLFLSGSTSALAVAMVGSLGLLAADKRYRASIFAPLIAVAGILSILVLTQPQYIETYIENALLRLTTERIDEANRPESGIENISARVDVLDGPPLLFFASNPLFLLIGVGPGLISLPSAAYIPAAPYFDEVREAGINSPPSSGLLLEMSNAGLFGLALWATIFFSSLRAFSTLTERGLPRAEQWLLERNTFFAIGITYLVQAPVSPIWPIVMGSGIGAACLASRRRKVSAVQGDVSPSRATPTAVSGLARPAFRRPKGAT